MMTQTVGGAQRLQQRKTQKLLPYMLLLPVIILYLTFTYYPFVKTIILSFSVTNKKGDFVRWVGLRNWITIVTKDDFWQIILTTFKYAALNLVMTFGIAMIFALMCTKKGKGARLVQTLFALPMAIASSPAAAIWLFIYRQDAGLLNQILGTHTAWLREVSTALPAVSIVTSWMHIGTSFIYLLVGFRNVPEDMLEAATLDGANAWQKATKILFPMASPQIFFVLFLNITSAFRSFAQIKLLTGGGPAGTTKTLVCEIYSQAMTHGRFMYACVYAFALFMVIFLVTRIQFLFEKRLVHYQ